MELPLRPSSLLLTIFQLLYGTLSGFLLLLRHSHIILWLSSGLLIISPLGLSPYNWRFGYLCYIIVMELLFFFWLINSLIMLATCTLLGLFFYSLRFYHGFLTGILLAFLFALYNISLVLYDHSEIIVYRALFIVKFIYLKQYIQSLNRNGGTFFPKRIIEKRLLHIKYILESDCQIKTNLIKVYYFTGSNRFFKILSKFLYLGTV